MDWLIVVAVVILNLIFLAYGFGRMQVEFTKCQIDSDKNHAGTFGMLIQNQGELKELLNDTKERNSDLHSNASNLLTELLVKVDKLSKPKPIVKKKK